MNIDYASYFGAINFAELALLRIALATFRTDREERDFLTDLLDEYATRPAFAKRQRPSSRRTTSNSNRDFLPCRGPRKEANARRRTPSRSVNSEEYRLLTVALAVLRSDSDESGFLSWWMQEYGALAVSGAAPDPVTEEELAERAMFLQSLGIDLS